LPAASAPIAGDTSELIDDISELTTEKYLHGGM